MFTTLFWKLAAERAVKTFAQTLASVLVVSGATLLTAGWRTALATAGMAALVSILTSVGSLRIGPADSPSVIGTDPSRPAPADTPTAVVLPMQPAAQPPTEPGSVPAVAA
jgi:Putative lactococcus lactis phage r1t holin